MEQHDDLFDFSSFANPDILEESEDVVEVEYLGQIGVVDLAFQQLNYTIKDDKDTLITHIRALAEAPFTPKAEELYQDIVTYGEAVIELIYREARRFQLADPKVLQFLVSLVADLTKDSVHGRKILKAILQFSTVHAHIQVAIGVAGRLADNEWQQALLYRGRDERYFEEVLQALFHMKDAAMVEAVLDLMLQANVQKQAQLQVIRKLLKDFPVFGIEACQVLLKRYVMCETYQLKNCLAIGLSAYRNDALPYLQQMILSGNMAYMKDCYQLIGRIATDESVALLIAMGKEETNLTYIIDALSFSRHPRATEYIVELLQREETALQMKRRCIRALAFVDGNSEQAFIMPYFVKGHPLYIDALFYLLRHQPVKYARIYVELLLDGNRAKSVESFITKLSVSATYYILREVQNASDHDMEIVIKELRKVNIIDKRVKHLVIKRLQQTHSESLRAQLYQFIAKFAHVKEPLFSPNDLYKWRDEETSPILKKLLGELVYKLDKNVASLANY